MIYETKQAYLDYIENQWEKFFLDRGYLKENPVPITSKIDSSVSLIGSTTSPLKKFIINKNIDGGRFIIQNCMRTQGLKNLTNLNPQIFGSYFKCMGILNQFSRNNLNKTVYEAFYYLQDCLKIDSANIRIRISSKDVDLIESIRNVDKNIFREFDTFPPRYYTHKYGDNILGITGRNFNIAIRKKGTPYFIDIGNVIIMENDLGKQAIEMGFGNQTLSMTYFGVDSTVAASRLADIFSIDKIEKMKFADAVISSAVLQYEKADISKTSSYYQKRLLKKYYGKVINYWKEYLAIKDDFILRLINEFIKHEYSDISFQGRNTWTQKKQY